MKFFKYIPNFITCLNLVCGSLSVVSSFEGFPVLSALFIFLAAFFDFFDGFFARLLKAYSNIGKELDSLADLISFGVAPAVIIYNLLKPVLLISEISFEEIKITEILILVSPILIIVFSALRLAKFNVDERQQTSFIGLPTPANAMFIASLPLILSLTSSLKFYFIILNLKFLLPLIFIQSFLLVSPLKMFSLKFKNLSFVQNKIKFIYLIVLLVVAVLFFIFSINFILMLPLSIALYVLLSIFNIFIKIE